jgi:cold shock CspA family protein
MSIKKSKSESITKTGVVKFYLKNKGYGFIVDDNQVDEYFFHASNTLEKDLQKDEKITYSLETGSRGVKAVDIKRV